MPFLTESRRLRKVELSQIRQMMQSAPSDAINLALGELSFPLPEILRRKALELLQTATPVYTPNAGLTELRQAISDMYPGSDPASVCVCNGAEEAVYVTLLALLNPGDTVAIPDPDYTAYSAICNILEANVIRLPFESDLLTVDWPLWEKLLVQNVKALILSHPSNPCGHVFTQDEAVHLSEFCASHHIVLIVDEIYARLYFTSPPPSFWQPAEHIISIGGVSKSHCMSGWRLGWVVSPANLISSIIKARQYVSTCSNWLSQKLGEYALSAEGLQAVDQILGQLRVCRSIVTERFCQHTEQVLIPPASPYIMLKVDGNDLQIAGDLAQKFVVTVPGSAFGSLGKGWLRINYAVPQDKLHQALDIICHELDLY